MSNFSFIQPDTTTAERVLTAQHNMHGCVNLDTRGRVGPAVSPQVGQEGAAETCRGLFRPSNSAVVVFWASLRDPWPITRVIMCRHKSRGYLRHAHPAVTRAPLYKEYLLCGTTASNEVEHKKSVMWFVVQRWAHSKQLPQLLLSDWAAFCRSSWTTGFKFSC